VGGGVQTGSTRHVGHFWPIVPPPGDCEDGELGGMKIGRGSRSIRRKPTPAPLCPPQVPLKRTRANPGCRGRKPVTNRLSYGVAFDNELLWRHSSRGKSFASNLATKRVPIKASTEWVEERTLSLVGVSTHTFVVETHI
jgi:hypothetical protein